jgi:haloalkane dehalogenase
MKALRTPDDRFANLPGWNYEPCYTDVDAADRTGDTLRVAHYEAGPAEAPETFLLMHGEPSWSYLYRHMASALVTAGHRVVMPDLVGFGRSDKPTELDDYTYERHVTWMLEWFDANDFTGLTFFGQDWGGLVGLRLVTARPDRFRRIAVSNTGLPLAGREPSEAFRAWQKFSREIPEFTVGKLVSGGCASKLPPEVIAAYDAPFPDESYKAGARIFPSLYPDGDDHPSNIANKAAWAVLESWTKPFLTCFSDGDPVTAGGQRAFERAVPGASGQRHVIVEGGGHFVQEDKGPELAAILVDFVASNPVG